MGSLPSSQMSWSKEGILDGTSVELMHLGMSRISSCEKSSSWHGHEPYGRERHGVDVDLSDSSDSSPEPRQELELSGAEASCFGPRPRVGAAIPSSPVWGWWSYTAQSGPVENLCDKIADPDLTQRLQAFAGSVDVDCTKTYHLAHVQTVSCSHSLMQFGVLLNNCVATYGGAIYSFCLQDSLALVLEWIWSHILHHCVDSPADVWLLGFSCFSVLHSGRQPGGVCSKSFDTCRI